MHDVAVHARGLAEEGRNVHVDRPVAEHGVFEDELVVAGRDADERDGAALAGAHRGEPLLRFRLEREDVALLRLAAPDLHRGHRRLLVRDGAQVEAAAGLFDELRAAVGEAAGAEVVDGEDGVLVRAEGDALVDHLLAAALHLGVAALDGVEVQLRVVGAEDERARGAAAEADAHRGAADLDDERALGDVLLERHRAADVAHAAGEHDRLVVAPRAAVGLRLERAEEAAELRAAELVAERGAADRALDHDRERRGEARGGARLALPRQRVAGNAQVRDHEAADAALGARADAGRGLVADLAADARRGAGEGRDGGRMVVRLHLHQDVDLVLLEAVDARGGVPHERLRAEALDDAGVVRVGHERALRVRLVRVADHLEERELLGRAVERPGRVEDLVAAVLGVHLAEHHDLRVGRVLAGLGAAVGEVVDLVRVEREAELDVRLLDRGAALGEHVEDAARLRLARREDVGKVVVDALRHAVVQRGERGREILRRNGLPVARRLEDDRALDAADELAEAARAEDVARLRAPRGDRALARGDVDRALLAGRCAADGLEQFRRADDIGVAEAGGRVEEVDPAGLERNGRAEGARGGLFELAEAEFGKGVGAEKREHGGRGRAGRPERGAHRRKCPPSADFKIAHEKKFLKYL